MIKVWLLAAALAISLTGCQWSQQARADPVQASLDRAFTLHGGHEATISGENLRLSFTEVLEDSRCPTQVDCFWTGQARIAVVVQQGDGPTTVEFNTNPAPGMNKQSVDVGEYVIELQRLDPYPETPDESIALENYRVTLLGRKAP